VSELNIAEWNNKNDLKLRMRVILADIFARYFYNYSSPKIQNSSLPLWLQRLMSDMEKPENFILGTQRMIELSHRSREHICRSIKAYYGVTMTDVVNGFRINYASNLLINTNYSIIEICFTCGFQNLGYFYKIFKKIHGISVGEFRKTYKIRENS
jgi:AraC family cel operon transcriptional repressor